MRSAAALEPMGHTSISPFIVKEIETPLGSMLVMADEQRLHMLQFTDSKKIDRITPSGSISGTSSVLDQIEDELNAYFAGTLKEFKTPIALHGSDFQQSVLKALIAVPYGQTRSYAEQAIHVGNPKAVRAVARGNSVNRLGIIIPCHRIIGKDGSLTGYAAGLERKKWLLAHEQKHL